MPKSKELTSRDAKQLALKAQRGIRKDLRKEVTEDNSKQSSDKADDCSIEQEQEIIQRYNGGESIRSISFEYGPSARGTIRDILIRNGIPIRGMGELKRRLKMKCHNAL